MAERLGESVLELTTDDTALTKGLDSAMSKAQAFGANLASIGSALSLSVTAPLVALGTFAVSNFNESAQAAARLDTVLQSTAGAVGKTRDELIAMSVALEANSIFGDDEILQKVTNQLLTFTAISGDVFGRAQQAVLDLSAALGNDLQGSAIQLGKALQDPVAGVAALKRVGVSFNETQMEMIKAFVETGNVVAAQNLILSEMEKEFAGAAEAASKFGTGPLTQLWNRLGNLSETWGQVILENVNPFIKRLDKLADTFETVDPKWVKFTVAAGAAAAALGPLLVAIGALITVITGPIGIAVALTAGISAIAGFVFANDDARYAISQAWEEIWDRVSPLLRQFEELFYDISESTSQIWETWGETIKALLSGLWTVISGNAKAAWTLISGVIGGALDVIKGILKAFSGIVTGDWDRFASGIKDIWNGLWTAIKSTILAPIEAIKSSVKGLTEGVTGAFSSMYDKIVGHSIVPDLMHGIEREFGSLDKIMKNPARAATDGVVGAFSNMFGGLIDGFTKNIPIVGGLVNDLLKKFADMGLDKLLGGLNIPGFGGGAASAAGGAARGAGGAASGAVGSAGTLASGGLMALGSGIGSFLGSALGSARQEGTLNAIEKNTRYTEIQLKDLIEQIMWPVHDYTKWIAGFEERWGGHLLPLMETNNASTVEHIDMARDATSGILATLTNVAQSQAELLREILRALQSGGSDSLSIRRIADAINRETQFGGASTPATAIIR